MYNCVDLKKDGTITWETSNMSILTKRVRDCLIWGADTIYCYNFLLRAGLTEDQSYLIFIAGSLLTDKK